MPLWDDGSDNLKKESEWVPMARQASLALAIPALLATGPLVGYFLGRWLGGLAGAPQLGGLIGLALGFTAGVRETIRLIRRIQHQPDPPDSNQHK